MYCVFCLGNNACMCFFLTSVYSSSDISDSEGEIPTSNLIPVAARATPYHHDGLSSTAPPQANYIHNGGSNCGGKKHLRYAGKIIQKKLKKEFTNW